MLAEGTLHKWPEITNAVAVRISSPIKVMSLQPEEQPRV
jgi:hypothetical protein